MPTLEGWENFYVIVGSSAGALIGLQFVVITLIAEKPIQRGLPQASGAFATPSVIHFGVVLLISAIVSAPWKEMTPVALLWGLIGLCGILYEFIVARRMRAQQAYQPVFEDWLFHVLLPIASYAMLLTSAIVVHSDARLAMFLVGAAALLLLFVGIHNAWDAITWHVFTTSKQEK